MFTMSGTNDFYFLSALDTFRSTAADGAYSDMLHVAANFVGTVLGEWRKLRPSPHEGNLSSFIRPATLGSCEAHGSEAYTTMTHFQFFTQM
jgi:hypothetical protein